MKRSDLTTEAVLTAVRDHFPFAYEHLAEQYPGKVVIAAFEREVRRDRLDYGVSLARPFLTPKGWSRLGERPRAYRSSPAAKAAFGLT